MQVSIENIREEILTAVQSNALVLPTMPEVSLRVREAAEDEDATIATICEVIGADAALAARVVKVANSALFRGNDAVDSLSYAVSRMGIPYTCNLAMGVAMEQLFQATSEAVDERLRASWTHSTEVASLSYLYCQHFTSLKPDQAALAGLVHEIGKLPVLVWADENDIDAETLDVVLEALHPELGERILSHWDFPEEIQRVPRHYTDFNREADVPDYVDLVTVANLHRRAGTRHPLAAIDWETVTAFERLGVSIDLVQESDFVVDADEARQMLH